MSDDEDRRERITPVLPPRKPTVLIGGGLVSLALRCSACRQSQVWALPPEALVKSVVPSLACCACGLQGTLLLEAPR